MHFAFSNPSSTSTHCAQLELHPPLNPAAPLVRRIQTCLASGVETLPALINELTLRRAFWRQMSVCVNQKCGVFGLNQFFILQ